MIKGSIICLLCISLFIPAYSQNDSVRSVAQDTIPKDSISVIAEHHSETKPTLNTREHVYKINRAVDIPIVAVGTGWSLYAFTTIYVKDPSSEQQILSLNKSDINGFDRWAVLPYSESLDRMSYYPFYASIPLPLIFFLTEKETRSDFAQLTFLYWEAMSITGFFGTGAAYTVDRYRPYTYTTETDMDKRTGSNAKNSFYSGHVAVVATPLFFIAKVYSDYHPESKIKWVFYGVASAGTVAMAYIRYEGGMHFPSDILLGTAVGVLSGILVPQFHKKRLIKNPNMSLLPFINGEAKGLTFNYKLN